MSKNKTTQKSKNQSLAAHGDDSAKSKTGYNSAGNSALSEDARNTKGKK